LLGKKDYVVVVVVVGYIYSWDKFIEESKSLVITTKEAPGVR